jgi:glucokinase
MDKADQLTLGVDLGGTKVETALIDEAGHIVSSEKHATQSERGPDRVIADIIGCVSACLGQAGKTAKVLGVGVAGQVDGHTGVVRFAPNLGWKDVPLRAKLEQALGFSVFIVNDVRAATWGEWRYGAGRGIDDLICLFIGTGIGGGIVSGGRLLEGCRNSAGELGHVPVVTGGRYCHCRNRGCLEAYVGGWAIAERAQAAVRLEPGAGRQLTDLAGRVEKISAATVAQAYSQGDSLAERLVEETAEYLSVGMTGFVNALNPCLIVLGGGVIQGLPHLASLVDSMVRVRALETAVEHLRVTTAVLGNNAGVVGAATLARHKMLEKAQTTAAGR